MQKQKNKERGITLIALVVSIIVLIILAGVSITMLVGDNGIITQAQRAKENTELAEQKEKEEMKKLEEEMNEHLQGIIQVTDKNPGELEVDEQNADTYVINSIEDLVFFAYDVTNGNKYESKTVKLGLNLDFHSDKSYVDATRTDYEKYGYEGELKTALTTGEGFHGIGTNKFDETTNSFYGCFDGNNKTIYNCYMNKDITDSDAKQGTGFFGYQLYGTVKNLSLVKVDFTMVCKDIQGYASGLSIHLNEGANVDNCHVDGSIKQYSNGNTHVECAGIVAFNRGTIQNSSNNASISAELNNKTDSTIKSCYIGGITINNEEGGIILNSCNAGKITANVENANIEIGGIARYNAGKDMLIENCYNSGNIYVEGTGNQVKIGGIVGYMADNANIIRNVYNKGDIEANLNNLTSVEIGEIVGQKYNTAIIENAYFLKDRKYQGIGNNVIAEGISSISVEDATNGTLLGYLNKEKSIWKSDANNINAGYPILQWQN